MNPVKIFILVMIIFIVFLTSIWIYRKLTLNNRNCTNLSQIYDSFPQLASINPRLTDYSYKLRDYYIKTAYNACSAGQYKNDFVNLCALKTAIQQGARCLDFEIYSLNDKPVIATSSVTNFKTKQTYNSIPFADAMNIVADYAFSGSTCPNPDDPLFLNFRIMSTNMPKIGDQMADDLYNSLEMRLLGEDYSNENGGKNFGITPLKDLMGKVAIIVDKSTLGSGLLESSRLDEYVNITSSSPFMRSYNYDGVKNVQDMNELIEFNKKCMTFVTPNVAASDANPSPALAMQYGCQFIAMAFQNFDSNMEYYDMYFDKIGTAFSLKPENLRYIPVTVNEPAPQNPALSYEKRDISADYYQFNI